MPVRFWRSHNTPVMCDEIVRTAELKIKKQPIESSQAIDLLQRLSRHPGQYCAMNIVEFTVDDTAYEEVEALRDTIVRKWESDDSLG